MKRTATSASRCFERITSGTSCTYSTARQSRLARSNINSSSSSASSQQTRRLSSSSSRPATSTTHPSTSTTLPQPARRLYSSQPSQTPSSTPPESSHLLREDTNAPSPSSTPKTHYSLFPKSLPAGPPPSGPFSIDLNQLKREFLQLQAVAHPDRHSGINKLRAEAASSAINEAYRTLEDPLRRANYLLELRGWETEECDKMGGEFSVPGHGDLHAGGGGEGQDMELLMEVMEAREAVEECETEEELVGLKEENEARIQDSIKVLEDAFAKDDLAAAKRESVRLRYWRNIGESLREWEGKGSQHVLQH